MNVNYGSLVNFISGEKIFSIPVYQRNIGWNKDNCAQLFKDIEELVDNGDKASHFIGTFIYQKQEENSVNYIIVDGQQRLASIILIAKALHDSSEDKYFRSSIRSAFIENSLDDSEYQFKLRPSEYDCKIFEKIMSGGEPDNLEKASQIYENYKFFKDAIANSRHKNNLQGLRKAISRLQIVAIGLSNEQAVQNSNRGRAFSTDPAKLVALFKIDENYYLDSKFSTKVILSIINDIAEKFDQISGTNFKDEIWFTLRE